MTPEQQKEEISKAYLQAIAARCGLTVSSWSQDHGNIDATVCAARSPIPGGRARAKLDIQLKCTARQDLLRDDFLSWDLERAHYDGLRCAAVIPHLLVVLLLPPEDRAFRRAADPAQVCVLGDDDRDVRTRDGACHGAFAAIPGVLAGAAG